MEQRWITHPFSPIGTDAQRRWVGLRLDHLLRVDTPLFPANSGNFTTDEADQMIAARLFAFTLEEFHSFSYYLYAGG